MIKVLVTGKDSQLAKCIRDIEKEDSSISFTYKNSKELDITDTTSVKNSFEDENYDYCINCAAYTNVEQAEKTPEIAVKVNAEGVKSLAKSCKTSDTILIHISTDYVFDGEKSESYTVDDIPNPINEYGKSKLKGEQYIQEFLKSYFIVRTSWLYSKKHGHNFYKTILEKTKTKAEISVATDQIGCPTDTVNLSRFLFNLINKKNNDYGIYHFSDEKSMTWYDFAKEILLENGINNKIKLLKAREYITFATRPKFSVLSNDK